MAAQNTKITKKNLRALDNVDSRRRASFIGKQKLVVRRAISNVAGVNAVSKIPVKEWKEAESADRREGKARDVGEAIESLSNVGRLVHLSARYDQQKNASIQATLENVQRTAFEDEISIQLRRLGCADDKGVLKDGLELNRISAETALDAVSITNTYNFDLSKQVSKIRRDAPRANRHVYAFRLRAWDVQRAVWKSKQVAEWATGEARRRALKSFVQKNNLEGYAMLEPRTAKEEICQGWIKRGEVPIEVAVNNAPPYHVGCPHSWRTFPAISGASRPCEELWKGG